MAWTSETVEEPQAPKTTGRRRKAPSKATEGLVLALNFVSGATDSDKSEAAKHVKIANNWIVGYDGTVAAGHPIEEHLTVCPHLERFGDALKAVGKQLSMTVSEGGRLMISGEKAKFAIPCLPIDNMPPVFPDPQCAVIDDRIKEGFAAVLKLAKDDAETVYEASILLRANSMVGCNGSLSLEYWHGIDLPPNLAIPQKAAKLIAKSAGKLTGFGFTWGRSATFYFENGAWVRTQLFAEEWPNIDDVLNSPFYGAEVPGLFEALDAIVKFSEDGAVHFHDDKLKTTYSNVEGGTVSGASYDLPGLIGGTHVSARLLKLAQPAAKLIDYQTHPDKMLFFNPEANMRGVMMKRV